MIDRRRRGAGTLRWLALAWTAAMLPVSMLVLVTLGLPFALPAFLASFLPAIGVWLLHQRVSRRKRRLSVGRSGGTRDGGPRTGDLTPESGNPPSDARSR